MQYDRLKAKESSLTSSAVRKLFRYDPETGEFISLQRGKGNRFGLRAGTINKRGYVKIGIKGKIFRAHRLAWLVMTGDWPEGEIDHIDRNPTNNRWSNLRIATRSQNCANKEHFRHNVGTHFRLDCKKWVASIGVQGRRFHLGCFKSEKAAAEAYKKAVLKFHGNFAPREVVQ